MHDHRAQQISTGARNASGKAWNRTPAPIVLDSAGAVAVKGSKVASIRTNWRRLGLAFTALCMALVAGTARADGIRYVVDRPASAVEAKVAFLGFAHKTARFPDMSGTFTLSPADLEAIDMIVDIDARTLTTGDSQTKILRGKDFFDVKRFPTVRFVGKRMRLTGDRTAVVDGQITARGVTRPLRLDVRFSAPPMASGGTQPIALTASTRIDRSAFGMTAYPFVVGRMVDVAIHARMVPQ